MIAIKHLYLVVILLSPALGLYSQNLTIKGKVTDGNSGEELPGVTLVIKGTSTGTITDFNGDYQLEVPKGSTLLVSFVGMKSEEVVIYEEGVYNISLLSDQLTLNEFVITALGIEREKKALGYSTQQVLGEDLHGSRDASMINQLAGKVAGLSISATNAGAGSSSRVVLRGNNSFMGNNNALIVVDGVPIENTSFSTAEDTWGGRDYGNGISDINPDDIESISVLKGAGATALYGSSAANGVILIVTKKGDSGRQGLGVTFTQDASITQPNILYDLQNIYGAGRNGRFTPTYIINEDGIPVYNVTGASAFGSWGPSMEGQMVIDWDGNPSTYSPQPNNYKDFFQNGLALSNALSFEGNIKNTSIRVSVADMRKQEIIENANFARTNLGLNLNSKILPALTLTSYVSYVNQNVKNRFGLSDSKENPNRNYIMMPRNISNQSLQNNIMNEEGQEQTWFMNWAWQGNPFYFPHFKHNADSRNRVFGNAALEFTPNDHWSFMIRTAPDFSITNYNQHGAVGARTSSQGEYSEREVEQLLINSDFLITYKTILTDDLDFVISGGGNAMLQQTKFYNAYTIGGLLEPGVYSIENSVNTPFIQTTPYYKKATNSLYGLAQFGFRNYLYVDLTARNDWSSTLPKGNNSYFYPSASLSFVYTELMERKGRYPGNLSLGKIRASYAQVGNDTEPYQLDPTFFIDSISNPFGTIAYITNQIPPLNLKPEKIHALELGKELIFFMNRLSLDFAWYRNRAINQILPADISHASGSTRALINAGEIRNSGIEVQFRANPVKSDNFSWDFHINYTKNNSMVVELTQGLDNLQILQHWNLSIEARPGNPYGDIVGYAILRDDLGNKLVDGNGMYLRNETPQVLGNINPDFSMSWSNNLHYKRFSLSFLLDARFGGHVFSGTNLYGYGYAGNFAETLEGRAEWYASERAREEAGIAPGEWTATGGYLANGVYAPGTIINGVDMSGKPNTTFVNPERYWSQFSEWTNEIHEPFVYDASFVKLRNLTLSYAVPTSFSQKARIKQLTVSLYGRNLWTIHKNVPNIDPETMHTSGNGQGYELYSYPNQRSFGISFTANI